MISDNIILATELAKGYNRAHLSPRCMLKVDLRKAYDSVEWPFLHMMLNELGFPCVFVDWIMECVKTFSYSILINGKPSPSFCAQKGLRQGDPLSPFLFAIAMEYLSRSLNTLQDNPDFNFHPKCERLNITHLMFADDLLLFSRGDAISMQLLIDQFMHFSSCSGLAANLDKSEVYFSGVNDDTKASILHSVGMVPGVLPVRYLGIPLSTKKLSIAQYKPLIDKFRSRVQSWTVRKLTYAGRLQLVKCVLFSLQTYWSQLFLLPKKVTREIERICRTFLWTGDLVQSRKAPIAWDSFCKPLVAGGWNIKNLGVWNKAALSKLLWTLAFKADMLWVKWVNISYSKGRDVMTMSIPKNLSWMLSKVWQCRELIHDIGGWHLVSSSSGFSIKKMYQLLCGVFPKTPWRKIICNSKASPRALFITWMALYGRLSTLDRLIAWGIQVSPICYLCKVENESIQHLFFECPYVSTIWRTMLNMLHISRSVSGLQTEVHHCVKMASTKTARSRIYLLLFVETIYCVWRQRNARAHEGAELPADRVVHEIVFRANCRCTDSDKHLLSLV